MKYLHLTLAVMLASLLTAGNLRADFNDDYQAAVKNYESGKLAESLDAFEKLAALATTDKQKSQALGPAVRCALRLKQYEKAASLARQLPDAAAALNTQANILQYQKQWRSIIELYHEKEFKSWSSDNVATAYSYLGNAHYQLKQGQPALDMYQKALEAHPSYKIAPAIHMGMGKTSLELFNDPPKAIQHFLQVYDSTNNLSRHAEAAVAIARIYISQNELDKAMTESSKKIPMLKLSATYLRVEILSTQAQVLMLQGKKDEAITTYKEALDHHDINPSQKKACLEAIAALDKK